MLRKIAVTLTFALTIALTLAAAHAATLSPALTAKLAQASDATGVGTVIVSFNTSNGLSESNLDVLREVCVTKGIS